MFPTLHCTIRCDIARGYCKRLSWFATQKTAQQEGIGWRARRTRYSGEAMVRGSVGKRCALLIASACLCSSMAFAAESWARVDPALLITAKEATDWHRLKDSNGPALSGNPSWQKFMGFVEDKLREY